MTKLTKQFQIISGLILISCLLTGYLLWATHQTFHSDDIGYWMVAQQWQKLFDHLPTVRALSVIYHWPSSRPTYHPLLGVPFLYATGGSIDLSTILIALLLLCMVSTSTYFIFRSTGLSYFNSGLAAAAIVTCPSFLGQARFFMAEYPFAAFSLSALAFLQRRRLFWFGIALVCALLERPLEGTLLLPAFILVSFYSHGSCYGVSKSGVVAGIVICVGLVILAYAQRTDSFMPWIKRTSFSANGLLFWRNLRLDAETLFFVPGMFFKIFGLTGAALVSLATYFSLKQAGFRGRTFLAFVGLLLMLAAIFFLIGCFDNRSTVEAAWRYSLAFFLFALLPTISQALRLAPRRAAIFLGAFISANVLVILSVGYAKDPFSGLPLSSSFSYHRSVLKSAAYPPGIKQLIEELSNVLPKKSEGILFVGESSVLYDRRPEIQLRCKELLATDCWFGAPGVGYLGEVFQREADTGRIELSKYGIGAVALARRDGSREAKVKPFPNAELLAALTKSRSPTPLGLERVGEISTHFESGPKSLEIFAVKGSR